MSNDNKMTPEQSRQLKARIASTLAADAWLSRRAERLRVQPQVLHSFSVGGWDEEDFLVSVVSGLTTKEKTK